MPDGSPSQPTVSVASVVVLAAGAGTRMRSALPKVLHELAGQPLLWHCLRTAAGLDPQDLVAVVGHGREQVGGWVQRTHPDVRLAVQDQQLGTGHAVVCAFPDDIPTGTVVVVSGDTPLLRPETLQLLVRSHQGAGNAVTVLTARLPDPTGYGRIVRGPDGAFRRIVEHKDSSDEQLAIDEINSGVYAFDGAVLAAMLPRLNRENSQGELYLTDVVGLSAGDGLPIGAVAADDHLETAGINDRVQLSDLARELNRRLVRQAQLGGVTVQDPSTTWLHADVVVAQDVVLRPNTSLEYGTVVESGAVIGPDTTLSNCTVAAGATVLRSHCDGAEIGPSATVGPYTHLRSGTVLHEGAKTGAYVETKNAVIGKGSKVPHLSYVGDAEIGPRSNIGAGVITANYDGATKSRTVIGERSFVGTNSTLVAPVTLGPGSFVAAGSTIIADVDPGDLAVARSRQRAVTGWVLRRRPGSPAAEVAQAALDTAAAAESGEDNR